MDNSFFIIAIIFSIFSVLIPVILSYLLYRWLTKKGYGKLGIVILVFALVLGVFSIFDTFYPTQRFYEEEFEKYSDLKFPRTASFLEMTSNYPNLSDAYFANASFILDQTEYEITLKSIERNNRFHEFENKENKDLSSRIFYMKNPMSKTFSLCFTETNNSYHLITMRSETK